MTEEVKTKVCTKCGAEKEYSFFYPEKNRNRLSSICRTCDCLRKKKYYREKADRRQKEKAEAEYVEITTKICNTCKLEKEFSEFSKSKTGKFKHSSICKDCINISQRKRYLENREEVIKRTTTYKIINSEKYKVWRKKYLSENRDRINESQNNWAHKNPGVRAVYSSTYRASKKKAIPAWANLDTIKEIYTYSKTLTEETGITHHVDHIIPLQNGRVCGLHVEYNLRVIPSIENLSKNNKLIEELL